MALSSNDLELSVTLFDLGGSRFVSHKQLKDWLPDSETTLWFAKLFKLDYRKLGDLLRIVSGSSVVEALLAGNHSTELQDYLVATVPNVVLTQAMPAYVETPPPGEFLPQLWEAATCQVAEAIQQVADKLSGSLALLPSKEGRMTFATMAKMNRLRPTIGDYQANIMHQAVPDVAVVLDVSGSMNEITIKTIINDVVAMSWAANAHLIIVSNHAYHWEPGSYNVADVLAKAEYGGTYYEELAPLFNRDWGVVITIADYDSSLGAKRALASCTGHISRLMDVSLVNRPTFLAECLGQLADEVTPLLVSSPEGLTSPY